ncbi:MAG TPA: prephenate dehydrogenase [Nocardioides bacterium]|uniref:prephenate dehydrogenase n=1 Tax=uncultured Nocardioides sp. TaxID=198441 RepID=UPI000EC0D4A7|nr:prephenate dehydrogenase [uncultured Nocardioides sp.]HCB02746.1 prephenate dehydrogenase [Nocardioides sp.]
MAEQQAGLSGPVEVIGTGLLGTSIGLALRRAGIGVLLSDANPEHVRTAVGLGAGRPRQPEDRPQLVVVAVPPDHLGEVIDRALSASDAVVTDVGSVKSAPLAAVRGHPRVARYVGSHPMAGSERSGPLAASGVLFDGRPWAVTPHQASDADAAALVAALATVCGAVPIELSPVEHDRAVARTSHVPHLLAALAAGRLADAPTEHLALSGQGVRDVTRVAAGDPALYGQIVTANSGAVLDLLTEVRDRLDAVIEAVEAVDRPALEGLLAEGVAGTRAIPGKHGGPTRVTESIFVALPDHPGELARVFADAGASGVNIEDVHMDHDPGRPVGLLELTVEEGRGEQLLASLESKGWVTHR